MQKHIFSLIFILTMCNLVHGQDEIVKKHKASNQIVLSLYDGAIINGMNITNTTYPDPIRAQSTLTNNFKVGLDFERITRNNLILGVGLELGSQPTNFDLVYESFDYVDTTQALKNSSAKTEFRNNSKYFALRFTFGYSFPLNIGVKDNYRLDAKVTIGKKFLFDGGQLSTSLAANYVSGDTTYLGWYKVMKLSGRWGNQDIKLHGPVFTEYNVGIRRKMNKSILGDFYLGIYASCNISMYQSGSDGSDVDVFNYHYLNGIQKGRDDDYYSTRNFTVGLRFGFGLKL